MVVLMDLPPDDPDASCKHCGHRTDLIQHDGPVVVCSHCIREMGQLAKDPTGVDERILNKIVERHDDVLRLVKGASHRGYASLTWEWIGW